MMENSTQIPQKIKIEISNDPELSLRCLSKLNKTLVRNYQCTPMFIVKIASIITLIMYY